MIIIILNVKRINTMYLHNIIPSFNTRCTSDVVCDTFDGKESPVSSDIQLNASLANVESNLSLI